MRDRRAGLDLVPLRVREWFSALVEQQRHSPVYRPCILGILPNWVSAVPKLLELDTLQKPGAGSQMRDYK